MDQGISSQYLADIEASVRRLSAEFILSASVDPWGPELLKAYGAVRDAIKQPIAEDAAERLLPRFEQKFRDQLLGAYNVALMKYEYHATAQLGDSIDWETFLAFPEFLYIPDFLRLALVEYDHCGFSRHSEGEERVVFVGGGSFPVTPIAFVLLHAAHRAGSLDLIRDILFCDWSDQAAAALREQLRPLIGAGLFSGLSLQVLDRDASCIAAAEAVIRQLGLSDFVSYQMVDIAAYQLSSSVRALVFAASIPDKRSIIPALYPQCLAYAPVRLVFRTVPEKSLRSLLYEPLPVSFFDQLKQSCPRLSVLRETPPDARGVITTTTISAEVR